MRQLIKKISNRLFPPTETLEGYDHPELVDVIFRKTLVYRPIGQWSENARTVLDFGGGCGLHYKEAGLDARWAVVETPAMVQRAKEVATERLQFFTSIKAAVDWLGTVDLMYSDGAIQYTKDPETTLDELVSLQAKVMFWKRIDLAATRETTVQTSNLRHNGPGFIDVRDKIVKYHVTRMAESRFRAAHSGYRLANHYESNFRFVRDDGR